MPEAHERRTVMPRARRRAQPRRDAFVMPLSAPDWERVVKPCRFQEPDRVPLMDIVTPVLAGKLMGCKMGRTAQGRGGGDVPQRRSREFYLDPRGAPAG